MQSSSFPCQHHLTLHVPRDGVGASIVSCSRYVTLSSLSWMEQHEGAGSSLHSPSTATDEEEQRVSTTVTPCETLHWIAIALTERSLSVQ